MDFLEKIFGAFRCADPTAYIQQKAPHLKAWSRTVDNPYRAADDQRAAVIVSTALAISGTTAKRSLTAEMPWSTVPC